MQNAERLPASLCIVVPCYNEEAVLPETFKRMTAIFDDLIARSKIAPSSHMLFVNDGSKDATWQLIAEASETSPYIRGLKLSRNRGHQIALKAGLMTCAGDIIISIDADLQDDLAAIEKMIDAHYDGADIVYGVRSSRKTDTFFKRFTAESYYSVLKSMGIDIVFNHADYRLMSRRAIEALREYDEANLFLRGLIPQLGFNTAIVEYERHERFAGESHYPLGKMISLAMSGITAFSIGPLRFITYLGLMIAMASFIAGAWSLVVTLFTDSTVPGWASTVVPLFFLGGVQLVSLGIIGEYVGRIYFETKRRPHYHIDQLVGGVKQPSGPKNERLLEETNS